MLSFAFHHGTVPYACNPTTCFTSWYNHPTFDLGCNPRYMVIIFLAFWSISFTPSLVHSVHSITPALYRTVGTTHVPIAWDTCFAFNFDFNVAVNLLKYYFLMFSVFFHLLTYMLFLKKNQVAYILLLQSDQSLHHFATLFYCILLLLLLVMAKTPHLSVTNFIAMSFVTISTVQYHSVY